MPKNWNPWSGSWNLNAPFMQLQKQMNQMMRQMAAGNSIFSQQGFGLSQGSPNISMQDEGHKYKITVDVPSGDNIKINTNLSGNRLTIDGKVKAANQSRSNNSAMRSLSVSHFSQTMNFPDPVNDSGEKVTRNGNEIVITVPKVG